MVWSFGPTVTLADSSADGDDHAIQFTTALSRYRAGSADSFLIRPACPDAAQFIDLTNAGSADLTISEIQINAPNVTVDAPLTAEIVLQTGQTRRLTLTYAPSLPTAQDTNDDDFDLAAGMTIFTNDPAAPSVDIRLRGASTFNSDITYDGLVNLVELGTLNVNFGKIVTDVDFDPTADINGDGTINFSDLGLLNAELGLQITSQFSATATVSASATAAGMSSPTAAPAVDGPADDATQDPTPTYFAYSPVTATTPDEEPTADPAIDASQPDQNQETSVPAATAAAFDSISPIVITESAIATVVAADFPLLLTDDLNYAAQLTAGL